MNDKIETQGKTVEEAVSEALLVLGARPDEVEVEVIEEPRSGFLGILGNRPARVRVTRKQSGGQRSARGRGRRGGDRRGGARVEGSHRGGTTLANSDRSEKGRSRDRDRDSSQSRDERRDEQRGAPRTAAAERDRGGNRSHDGRDNRRGAAGQGAGDQNGERDGTRRRRRRGGRSRRRRTEDQPTPAVAAEATATSVNPKQAAEVKVAAERGENQSQSQPQEERQNIRQEDRREGPRAEAPVDPRPAPRPEAPAGPANEQHGRGFRREEPAGRPAAAAPAAALDEHIVAEALRAAERVRATRERNPDDPEVVTATLHELTVELMRLGQFPSRCEVVPGEYHLVKIVTDDDSAGRLIGRYGAGVDAVEHLVDRMATLAFGERIKMNLDINNYRRKREQTILDRARAAVAMVKSSGEEEHLEPLCARERRIVHLAVKEVAGLVSFTVAGPGGKHVVVAPDDGRADHLRDDAGDDAGNDDDDRIGAGPAAKVAPAAGAEEPAESRGDIRVDAAAGAESIETTGDDTTADIDPRRETTEGH